MLPTIELYHQLRLVTVKIDNVVAYDALSVDSQVKVSKVSVP